jgi:hypothetical protein
MVQATFKGGQLMFGILGYGMITLGSFNDNASTA